jgi:hypothetical protein
MSTKFSSRGLVRRPEAPLSRCQTNLSICLQRFLQTNAQLLKLAVARSCLLVVFFSYIFVPTFPRYGIPRMLVDKLCLHSDSRPVTHSNSTQQRYLLDLYTLCIRSCRVRAVLRVIYSSILITGTTPSC